MPANPLTSNGRNLSVGPVSSYGIYINTHDIYHHRGNIWYISSYGIYMIYIIIWEESIVKIDPKSLTVWNGMAVWNSQFFTLNDHQNRSSKIEAFWSQLTPRCCFITLMNDEFENPKYLKFSTNCDLKQPGLANI